MTRRLSILLAFSLLASVPAAPAAEEGWISLFDGKTLAGWKAAESPASFRVVDGTIACDGPKAHLFYVGADGQGRLRELRAVRRGAGRKHGANSGVFFHTAFQEKDWPAQGFEVQVDNSQERHGDYLELKMTGSLYGIRNVYKALAKDDEWFTLHVTVRKPRVQVRVNDTLVVDWIEPPGPLPEGAPKLNRLGRGTFALQCHDPESKAFYRDLRVKPLPSPPAVAAPMPLVDERYVADPGARQAPTSRSWTFTPT